MVGMSVRRRAVGLVIAAIPVVLGLAGCFNPFKPNIAPSTGIPDPPPALFGPEGTVRRFQWCWNHRNYDLYRELFSDDFKFVFATGDSAGNFYRDKPLTRSDELGIAKNAFLGGGSTPPATNIVLTFDQTLHAVDDTRPGKNPGWHQQITTNVDLSITVEGTPYRVSGQALFYLVRADSASIPTDLANRDALKQDQTRWFIDEWDDLTLGNTGVPSARLRAALQALPRGAPPARAQTAISWGDLQTLYLSRPF